LGAIFAQRNKLLDGIVQNPKDVRFADACKAAQFLGFAHVGGKGSHRSFGKLGEPTQLNFQDKGGKIPPYQARQLIAMIEAYGPMRSESDD
jgi:hypothetical protein